MLDEAPTFAAVLGLDLPDAEGAVLQDVLARCEAPASEAIRQAAQV